MFRGSITALITPFRDGALDRPALDALIERQIAAGSHGIVMCGTTGESPTISGDEHTYIIERAVAVVKGRIPVIAGTGSNATAKTVDMTRAALKAGADAALIVTPYYNRPSQEGLYAHYRAVAEAVKIPILIYNVPARCGVDIHNDTVARLSEIPNIVGVKDATGDLTRPLSLRQKIGDNFCQLTGNDDTAAAFLANGGHGFISVTSNVAPVLCRALYTYWQERDLAAFAKARDQLTPLNRALFAETNPIPTKYALNALGLCQDEIRLPLLPANAATRQMVDAALTELGLDQNHEDIQPRRKAV